MKRKVFLSILAASLTLISCGKKKNEPTPGPVDPLTPEQRANATATNSLIYDFVKDSYGDETAEANKDYILARSEHAAVKGVSGTKIASYLEAMAEVDRENPLEILNLLLEIRGEDGLDDAIYFAAALGQSYLKIATDKADEDNKPYFEVALAEVEKETDNIASNAYAIVDNVTGIVDTILNHIEDYPEIMQFVGTVMFGGTISGSNLKAVLHDVKVLVIEELAKTQPNVNYFATEGVAIGAGLLSVIEEVPAVVVDYVKEISLDGVVGSLYEGLEKFGEAIDDLSDSYYEHFDEITIPQESYAYAVLGAVEELASEAELPSDSEIDMYPTVILAALMMLDNEIKDELPENVQAIIAAVLADAQFKNLLDGIAKCAKDAIHAEMPEISSKEIAHVIGLISQIEDTYESTEYSGLSLDDLKDEEIVPAEYQAIMSDDVAIIEQHITDHPEETTWIEDKVIIVGDVTEDEGSYGYTVEEVYYSLEYYAYEGEEGYFTASYEVVERTVKYDSLQYVADLIDTVLAKLADKDNTDLFIDDVVGVVSPLVQLFTTHFYSLVSGEIAKNEELAKTVFIVMTVVGMLSVPTILDGVKTVVNDLFVAIRDIFGVFMPENENPAVIDFSKVFAALVSLSPEVALQMISNSIPESYLANVSKLGEDIYNIPSVGSMIAGMILEQFEIEEPDEFDAEKFGEILYDLACLFLCPIE